MSFSFRRFYRVIKRRNEKFVTRSKLIKKSVTVSLFSFCSFQFSFPFHFPRWKNIERKKINNNKKYIYIWYIFRSRKRERERDESSKFHVTFDHIDSRGHFFARIFLLEKRKGKKNKKEKKEKKKKDRFLVELFFFFLQRDSVIDFWTKQRFTLLGTRSSRLRIKTAPPPSFPTTPPPVPTLVPIWHLNSFCWDFRFSRIHLLHHSYLLVTSEVFEHGICSEWFRVER